MTGRERELAEANARRLKSTIRRVEQQPYDTRTPVRQPRLASSQGPAYCQLAGSLGPATGSWPTLTATSTTADVYRPLGGVMSLIATGATIYNWRNVTWAAGKTTLVIPDSGGWAAVDQDC